tara:strand:+ start:6690 stop:7064 length:375 start_codon:yes stop_codon:yes gene_type:complete
MSGLAGYSLFELLRIAINPHCPGTGGAECCFNSRERSASTYYLLRFTMTNQKLFFSQQVREFFTSELFSLMLNISAMSGSPGHESYCTLTLAKKARIDPSHARKIVKAEIKRRQEACVSLGGAE